MSMIDISDQEMRHMTDEELRQNKDALRRSPTRNVANNIIGRIIDEQLRRAALRGAHRGAGEPRLPGSGRRGAG